MVGLSGFLPILEPHREALLEYGTPLSAIVAAVLIGAWHAFWRWLEPKLPDWLTRAVLGSAKTPVYGRHEAGAPVTGHVTITDSTGIVYDSRERPKE